MKKVTILGLCLLRSNRFETTGMALSQLKHQNLENFTMRITVIHVRICLYFQLKVELVDLLFLKCICSKISITINRRCTSAVLSNGWSTSWRRSCADNIWQNFVGRTFYHTNWTVRKYTSINQTIINFKMICH